MISEKLVQLEQHVEGFDVAKLAQNEAFLTVILQAVPIAIRNHQQEKIDALLNAIVTSALQTSVDENLQQMFLMFIDSFTEWHLRLLLFLNNPTRSYDGASMYMGNISSFIESCFPDLQGRREFYSQIVNDLDQRGLTNTGSITINMTSDGLLTSRTTHLGKQFIEFISTKF